ncbi:MAG: hypothetical protein QM737_22225 [Ferruginibacter sp.]
MKYEEFQKSFEDESDKIFKQLSKLDEADLLQLIAEKDEGKYRVWAGKDNYQVWHVLKTKGTQKSIKPLFEIVRDLKNDYLIRYHACDALFGIAEINDNNFKGQIQFGLDENRQVIDREKAFNKLETILNKYFTSAGNE